MQVGQSLGVLFNSDQEGAVTSFFPRNLVGRLQYLEKAPKIVARKGSSYFQIVQSGIDYDKIKTRFPFEIIRDFLQ